MRRVAVLFALLYWTSMALPADQIWLRNGKSLEGEFSRLEDGRIEIRTDFGSFRFAESQVVRMERGKTFEQEVQERLQTLELSNLEDRYALARRCADAGSFTLARRILQDILLFDPDHERARKDLGYLRYEGRWLTETEWHAARGEVNFRGRWIQEEEKQRILEEETRIAREARERSNSALQEAMVQARLSLMEAEIRELRRQRAAREIAWDEAGMPLPYYPYPYLPRPRPLPLPTDGSGEQSAQRGVDSAERGVPDRRAPSTGSHGSFKSN